MTVTLLAGDKRRRAAKHTEDMEGYLGDYSPLHSERGLGVRLLLAVTLCVIG